MIIIKTVALLQTYLAERASERKIIGFVPTMGALHKGHTSLVKAAVKEKDLVVCSVFVNPTQFTSESDLLHYPRTIEHDIEALETAGCAILFLPSADEIYPPHYQPPHYLLGELELVLEGQYRPGHFQGVCQVVDRLLQLVKPENIYLGLKDYQQCMVIQRLISITGSTTSLHKVATTREADGLAMSSRNLRLSNQQRQQAPELYQVLQQVAETYRASNAIAVEHAAAARLNAAGFNTDYVSICDAATLQAPAPHTKQHIVLAAAYLGDVRLIDNLLLN